MLELIDPLPEAIDHAPPVPQLAEHENVCVPPVDTIGLSGPIVGAGGATLNAAIIITQFAALPLAVAVALLLPVALTFRSSIRTLFP